MTKNNNNSNLNENHKPDAVLRQSEESAKPQKKMTRFQAFLFNRRAAKAFKKEAVAETALRKKQTEAKIEKPQKDMRKLNEYLSSIEEQLDKVDEQNKTLLSHLNTVKENNETLLEQVKVLSKNNEQLYNQFQTSKRREKIAKIVAVISSCLAIGFWVYRFISILLGRG
jgi:small-conductance mechanosensitive channel